MPMKVTGIAKSRPQDATPGRILPKSAPASVQSCQFEYMETADPR